AAPPSSPIRPWPHGATRWSGWSTARWCAQSPPPARPALDSSEVAGDHSCAPTPQELRQEGHTMLTRIDLRGRTLGTAELRRTLPRGAADVDSVVDTVRPVVEVVREHGAAAAPALRAGP